MSEQFSYEEPDEYFIYYKTNDGTFRTLSSKTAEFKTYKATNKPNHLFHILSHYGYEANDSGLTSYMNDFKIWIKELKYNKILSIRYTKYYSDNSAVKLTFKRLSKGLYEDHEPIDKSEYKWFQRTYNGGMMVCEKGVTCQSYGYDFSAFYPTILASKAFMIPSRQGEEIHLKKLPEINKIRNGFYRVKITCDNEHFKKLFAFSKQNTYLHTSLYQAMKYQDKYDVKIKLIKDDEPNAYLYDDSDLVSGTKIFGDWFRTMNKLKKAFPKNKLIKFLTSSLSGHLSERKIIAKTYEQIEEEGLSVGFDEDQDCDYVIIENHAGKDYDYYTLQNIKQPLQFNLRIMPFLTAYGRNKIARQITDDNIKYVIRIHTDGIAFKTKQEFKQADFNADDKTTGMINWVNVNSYSKEDD